jgi:hypothetical protein
MNCSQNEIEGLHKRIDFCECVSATIVNRFFLKLTQDSSSTSNTSKHNYYLRKGRAFFRS